MNDNPSMFILSLPFYGIQSVWSTEMAFAPPYLLSLGIPRGWMSLILLAAPLSGLLVQPIFGHYTDNSRSKWGRRRPYMVIGCMFGASAMLSLGYAEAIFGQDTVVGKAITITIAIIALYIIDFSVNMVMAVDRALLVDVLQPEQQDTANAWASLMVSTGQVVGYWTGSINLPRLLPFLGQAQIEGVSALTTFSLVLTHALAVYTIKEKPLAPSTATSPRVTFMSTLLGLWEVIKVLPWIAHRSFTVQFWSWLSQFPASIFTTVYVGDIYRLTHEPGTYDPDAPTRAGSRALAYMAIVSLFTVLIVPRILKLNVLNFVTRGWFEARKVEASVILCATWAASQAVSAFVMFSISNCEHVETVTALAAINGFCTTVNHWVPFAIVGEALLLEAGTEVVVPVDADADVEVSADTVEPLLGGPRPEARKPVSSGAAMGVLNMFICLPQFIVIGLSSLLFAILEPGRTEGGAHGPSHRSLPAGAHGRSITLIIMFRLAAISGLIALFLAIKLTMKVRREGPAVGTSSYAAVADSDLTTQVRGYGADQDTS